MDNKELNNESIQNNNSVQPQQANFSQIFNVESEEQQPQTTVVQEEQPQPRRHIAAAFNGNEEVLYTVEEEKEGSAIVPILLIGALIALIFFLPYISKKIEFSGIKNPNQTVNQEEQSEEEIIYEFNKSSVRARIGTLEFTNFVKSKEYGEYLLSFTINNVGEKSYDFSKKYYIEMLDGQKTIYYALIHSYDGLGALSATTLSIKLSKSAYDNAKQFKIKEYPTAAYPNVRTTNVEGDYDILTCVYNNNTIKYSFLDGELHEIYDEHNESKEGNVLYDQHKTLYQNYSNKYKTIENISSIFIETETDFRMINEVELKNISPATMASLRTYRFFKYKESIKTVSFELEAQGYTCG
jgi:hypothetical protein